MTKKCPRCGKSFDQAGQFCPDDGAPLTAGSPLDPAIAAALADDYRVLDWLGAGGMGTVFLAEQIRVGNRKVALKVLHRRFSEDEEFTTRFQNEAASTGRINHPNVITIYESKQAPDRTLYIAMELVEGESLTEHLRKRGRLPLADVVDIVSQCGKALQAAHRLGIIHRDIKPDNIMLTRDLDGALLVKILDFGIAKLKDSSGHTVTGSVLGTPAYMSYEQASGLSSDKLDGRSDIYSLGIVTYTMLVGHPPFRSDTPVGYISKHLSEAPAPPRTLRPDLPAAVEVAVLKALEKDREKRFQSAADFAGALRDAVKPLAETAAAAGAREATPTSVPPWRTPGTPQATEAGLARTPTMPVVGPPPPARDAVTLIPAAVTVPLAPPGPPTPSASAMPPASATPPAVPPPPLRPLPPPSAPSAARPSPGSSKGTAPPAKTGAAGSPAGVPPVSARPAAPRRPPVPAEEPYAKQGAGSGAGEGVAVALWGLRTLISWGIGAYALVFLALFAWPLVTPVVGPSALFPVVAIGQPVVQQVAQWLPPLRFGNWDPLPLALAILLLVVRPRLTNPLWRLEARCRARSAVAGLAG